MIILNDIKKTYTSGSKEYPALKGVSLKIDKGEYVAIVGTSGSGKSTLLNILGGMDNATEGSYLFDDGEIHKMNSHELYKFRKKNVSFVFQRFALLSQYNVYENVEVPLIARGINRKERKKRIMDALHQVGIDELYRKKPSELSGGEQQRCAIARALVTDCQLILADEPTGSLDTKTGEKIMSLLEKLNNQGKTLIIVTHDMNIAAKAGRMIKIEDGLIAEDVYNDTEKI